MEFFLNFIILIFLSFITIAIIKINNLFSLIILTGTYSFLMASLLIVMDAVDVGMTEAAVGAGVSTVLLLSALYLNQMTMLTHS